jgi:hypothetical protein
MPAHIVPARPAIFHESKQWCMGIRNNLFTFDLAVSGSDNLYSIYSIVPVNYVINTDAAAAIPSIFNTFIASGYLSLPKSQDTDKAYSYNYRKDDIKIMENHNALNCSTYH